MNFLFILKVANIRCFILIKCSEQKARYKLTASVPLNCTDWTIFTIIDQWPKYSFSDTPFICVTCESVNQFTSCWQRKTLWSWSYSTWIYNYLCNQCLSPLKVWVRTPFIARCTHTTVCDKVCQWLATGRWLSPGTLVCSTNKTDLLLKVTLSTINHIYLLTENIKRGN